MQTTKVTLFNIEVDALSMAESVQFIDEAIQADKQLVHNSLNANKVVLMQHDLFLKSSLQEADMVSADGQAVVWTSKFLGKPLPERVSGIDLLENLMEMANKKGYKAFLFGAREPVVKAVNDLYNKKYNNAIIAGYRNGYYSSADEDEIVRQINNSGAKLLFVAIPSPQKELFINKYRQQLSNILFLMGVGGSFDVISNTITRAPRWMQNSGLEWLFRLIQEPRKMWRRYLIGNLKYMRIAIIAYFSKNN